MSPEQKAVVERAQHEFGKYGMTLRTTGNDLLAIVESLASQLAAKESMLAKAVEVVRPFAERRDRYEQLMGFSDPDVQRARAFLQEVSR